jgi:hypothetical protein
MVHELSNRILPASMTRLEVEKFGVGIPFAEEREPRSFSGNVPAQRCQSQTFHLQLIAKQGLLLREGSRILHLF